MQITIGTLIYWLAISGIGQVQYSHADRYVIERDSFRIETGGGGGGTVDSKVIYFPEHTYRADLWWNPPFERRHDKGGSYRDRRWHLKTLIDKPREAATAKIANG